MYYVYSLLYRCCTCSFLRAHVCFGELHLRIVQRDGKPQGLESLNFAEWLSLKRRKHLKARTGTN